MRNEIDGLLEAYRAAMSGDAWYGDPVWTLLPSIDEKVAACRVAPGVHTIWELVEHMAYWENVARERMTQRVVPSDELNFPAMPSPTDANWQAVLQRLRDSNQRFEDAVKQLRPDQLDAVTPGGRRTFRADVEGVIQHHIYHIGQIALLAKLHAQNGHPGL